MILIARLILCTMSGLQKAFINDKGVKLHTKLSESKLHADRWQVLLWLKVHEYAWHGYTILSVKSSWNVMAHSDTQEGKWRGNWQMQWVASTLHTTSEHGVSSITTADAHTSAASCQLNWPPLADLNGLVRFMRKTKSGFCACAITFQTQSTICQIHSEHTGCTT